MMSWRARLTALMVPVLSVALLMVTAAPASADTASADTVTAPPDTPTATSTAGVRTAGPLFFGALADGHGCSASVVHSPGHDLIVTAAHCISGQGAGISFVPGYDRGATPLGVWTTTKAWVSRRWITDQDPQADVAFLQVAPQRLHGRLTRLEDSTGANILGFAPRPGTVVTDPAYPAGVDDAPIICTAPVSYTGRFPTFNCFGYFGGTSGSPFLVQHPGRRATVVGVIGGLHQGGCYDWNSFSSAFGADTFRTYLRAVTKAPADTVPAAGGDGC